MLGEKQMTLTDISAKLGLAPSTVSQHIKELLRMGAIRETAQQYSKKWRYYEAVPEFNVSKITRKIGESITIKTGGIITAVYIISIIAVVIAINLLLQHQYVVQLTDPPFVPLGTQALLINYSNVELHVTGSSASAGAVYTNYSGTINLMNLTNLTQTIAIVNKPGKEEFNSISFNISSAEIVIGNQTYPVNVPESTVNVAIRSEKGNPEGALIDFMPSVLEVYRSNQSLFVLVPSATAVQIPRSYLVSASHVGLRSKLNPAELATLASESSKLSITNATITQEGKYTIIRIEVVNNGNSTVVVRRAIVYGYLQSVNSSNSSYAILPRASGSSSSRQGIEYYGIPNYAFGLGQAAGVNAQLPNVTPVISKIVSIGINSSNAVGQIKGIIKGSLNSTARSPAEDVTPVPDIPSQKWIAFAHSYHNTMNFLVASNGTLLVPYQWGQLSNYSGYMLQPKQSATLTFNGSIAIGSPGSFISVIPNETYGVVVIGSLGAYSSKNYTS